MTDRIRFPLKVAPRADEPSYGLLARTAEHNGVRLMRRIFGQFGVSNGFLVNNVDAGDVAFACRADPVAVAHASPVTTYKSVDFMGQSMHRDHYSVARRRWCPLCLKEDPYHRGWWDVVSVTTCPAHGVELAHDCGCGKNRNWQSFGTVHCQVGHDLRDVGTAAVDPADLAADGYLVNRLTGVDRVSHPMLDSMPMGEAIIAMERLGQAWHDEAGRMRRAREAVGVRGLLNTGFRIASGFPAAFVELLDRLVGDERERRGKWGVTRAYGEFYYWVDALPQSAFADAMKGELADHARRNLLLKTGHELPDARAVDNGYLLSEAAARCGVAANKFRRMAVELGLMQSERRRGHPARLDRARVDAIAERFQGAMTMKDVARELNIKPDAMGAIIKDGVLTPMFYAGQSGLNNYDFAAGAADDLLARLAALPVRGTGPGERLAPLNVASQQSRITVSRGLRLVLDGIVQIAWVDRGASGISRFLVSPSALVRVARQEKAPGLTITDAAPLLGLSYNSTADFLKKKVLFPIPDVKGTYLAPSEVERFKRTYVTVPELSAILGTNRPRDAIALLTEAGVKADCERPAFWKVLYRREEAVAAARAIALNKAFLPTET